jgi:hypothetical protein
MGPISQGVFLETKKQDKRILYRAIIQHDLKPRVCAGCGITEVWNERPLRLEIMLKDGNQGNNNVDNLEILCPICHKQRTTKPSKPGKVVNDTPINTVEAVNARTDEELREKIESCKKTMPLSTLLRDLEMKNTTANLNALNYRIKTSGLARYFYEFRKHNEDGKAPSSNDVHLMMTKIRKYEMLVPKCAVCDLGEEYQGGSAHLGVYPINNDKADYRFDNLEFRCPNCASQARTYPCEGCGGWNKSEGPGYCWDCHDKRRKDDALEAQKRKPVDYCCKCKVVLGQPSRSAATFGKRRCDSCYRGGGSSAKKQKL